MKVLDDDVDKTPAQISVFKSKKRSQQYSFTFSKQSEMGKLSSKEITKVLTKIMSEDKNPNEQNEMKNQQNTLKVMQEVFLNDDYSENSDHENESLS